MAGPRTASAQSLAAAGATAAETLELCVPLPLKLLRSLRLKAQPTRTRGLGTQAHALFSSPATFRYKMGQNFVVPWCVKQRHLC